ncbi:MAG: ATP-binding protein [Saccharospirillum sp.]
MFLKKFVFVNWGNIPLLECDFGPINLLSGGNGSGKTTAADAIQTIMTAAHDTLFHFNPGQDEASQRGRGKQVRTLASYVLGCDDGSYARPDGAVGYLAAVFHPTQGEPAEPFTAVIGISAFLDKAGSQTVARLADTLYMIAPGEQLGQADFVQEADIGREIVALDKIAKRLKSRGLTVEKYDTKKQYLRRLYAAIRGRSDAISEREALNAARAFSRFMAYKPVKGINAFVAQEILEQKDLGEAIRTVSDLMKTISGMEAEASRLKKTIDRLVRGRHQADTYIHQWLEYNLADYVAARSRFIRDQQRYLSAKHEQQTLLGERDDVQADLDVTEQRREQMHQQLVSIEAQRRGVSALQDKDQLERKIEDAKRQLAAQAEPLLQEDERLRQSLNASESIHQSLLKTSLTTEIPQLASGELGQLARSVVQQQGSPVDFRNLLNQDWVDATMLEQQLDDVLAQQALLNRWRQAWFDEPGSGSDLSLRDQLQRLQDRREQKLVQLRQTLARKQQDIDSLTGQRLNYPLHVRTALDAIQQVVPAADPRVLCDHVEINDSAWQSAIEGYLGGARFAILVEPECEADAIRAVRALPKENRARVIQGSKARQDAERIKLPPRSIVHLMQFDHATARDYLIASYGLVEQCDNEDSLKKTRRGVTSNGLGSGAYAMYRCDLPVSDLVFGQGARERAVEAKKAELLALAAQANELQAQVEEVRSLYDAVNRLAHLRHGDLVRTMLEIQRALAQAEQGLAALDLGEGQPLELEYQRVLEQLQAQEKRIRSLTERKGSLGERLESLAKQCQLLSDQQDDTAAHSEQKEQALREIGSVWPDFDVEVHLQRADDEAQSTDPERQTNLRQSLAADLNTQAHELEMLLKDHNQDCQPQDAIVLDLNYSQLHSSDFFQGIVGLRQQVDQIHNRLKNNILVDKVDHLSRLKESFNNAFVTNLCHAIYQSINDGKRVLENLNKELEQHRFGADQERYWFDWAWVPEYKEYWHFFDEVIKSPSLGEGQTLFDTQLSQRSEAIRDQLMAMLLDEDEQKALRELERVSDYRNYRNYEIYKQPEGKQPIALSQYGTGSGGQLETPAYIIRSAAITSAFRFSEGDSHLRMVLVDEAFSKMDETRSKEVIRYLTEALGLQLLFIMPTSKSGPFMDMISNQFVFSKVPLANGQRIGQLATRVLVDRQQCNQDRIRTLWANHRKVIRQQAELDFLADVEG